MRKVMFFTVMILVALCLSPAVQAKELVGMISSMEGNVAVVSLPKSTGIEQGMILYVYRQGAFVGRAEVSEAGLYCSRIMALPETKGLKVGDAVLSRPACEMYRPLPPYGKNVSPNFILRETDGRAVVVGKIERGDLERIRDKFHLSTICVNIQSADTGEEFPVILSSRGYLFLELQPGTYIIENVHVGELAGMNYNAWGIPLGIVPGFMMRHGGKIFPISYKFVVPEKSNVVYIGTLKLALNPDHPFNDKYQPLPTYASVADEYDSAMEELAKFNPFVRKIANIAETHLEASGEKSLMELVPAGPGALFLARGDRQMAVKEFQDSIRYYEAPYKAEAHNALANLYWDMGYWEDALTHYKLAKALGYPVSDERMKYLARYNWLTRPPIDDY
ncbi:MAG: tetratricopeptide repeat protein [Candidatus Eremiobacteraeota bacterium]|nr:tetratricopeptide repeat protein [Candidatus Eremiobacteraeota bacterium]